MDGTLQAAQGSMTYDVCMRTRGTTSRTRVIRRHRVDRFLGAWCCWGTLMVLLWVVLVGGYSIALVSLYVRTSLSVCLSGCCCTYPLLRFC